MQSQKFGADKIVAWCEILGNVNREMAVIRDELLGAPLAGGAVIVLLENLEPTIADCRVGNSIVDFLHVHRTRTFVADIDRAWLSRIRPVTELERQLGTSVCTANA